MSKFEKTLVVSDFAVNNHSNPPKLRIRTENNAVLEIPLIGKEESYRITNETEFDIRLQSKSKSESKAKKTKR